MTDTTYPSLWREGLRAFKQSWRLWARWGILFAGLGSLISIIATTSMADSFKVLSDLNSQTDPLSPEEAMAVLEQVNLWGLGIYALINITLTSIAYYIFVIFYTVQEQPLGRTGTASFQGFMSIYWKAFLGYMVAFLPFLGAIIASTIAAAMGAQAVAIPIAFVGVGAMLYLTYRYQLVMALAAVDVEDPLRQSWYATNGQVLRMIGNGIIFMIVSFFFVFMTIILPGFGLTIIIKAICNALQAEGTATVITACINEVVSSLMTTLMSGLFAAYSVCTAKILTQNFTKRAN